jgi:hypothetical protein
MTSEDVTKANKAAVARFNKKVIDRGNELALRTSVLGDERFIVCSACGTTHDELAWAALECFERVQPQEVRRFILQWPSDVCIEVRVCRCGRQIAARRQTSATR